MNTPLRIELKETDGLEFQNFVILNVNLWSVLETSEKNQFIQSHTDKLAKLNPSVPDHSQSWTSFFHYPCRPTLIRAPNVNQFDILKAL